MSCNGCRVLRKGCSQACVLRSCLHWIDTPEAQGNATLFLAKFFGRTDLLSFISAVPEHQRPALFQSLLFEVCGRTVNPVSGAVGLLSGGNWHLCKAAVDTVLNGGVLKPMSVVLSPKIDESSEKFSVETCMLPNLFYQSSPSLFDPKRVQEPFDIGLSLTARSFVPATSGGKNSSTPIGKRSRDSISLTSEEHSAMTWRCSEIGDRKERKLLNLFV